MKAVDKNHEESPAVESSRFSELEELQREIALRIKDNQRFLAGFLNDDYIDEEEEDGDEAGDFEEL